MASLPLIRVLWVMFYIVLLQGRPTYKIEYSLDYERNDTHLEILDLACISIQRKSYISVLWRSTHWRMWNSCCDWFQPPFYTFRLISPICFVFTQPTQAPTICLAAEMWPRWVAPFLCRAPRWLITCALDPDFRLWFGWDFQICIVIERAQFMEHTSGLAK